MKHKRKAVIIGAGVGGLATAIRLAQQGIEVIVYEKNDYPGGKLSAVELDGFHFDAGPSLFVQPENLHELFSFAGEDLSSYLQYTPVQVACKYFYEDGVEITAPAGPEGFAAEVSSKTAESADAVKRYLEQSKKVYENIGTVFLNHSLHRHRSYFRAQVFKALRTVRPKLLFRTLNGINTSAFKDPHVIQLFNRYATYSGSDPYRAPGMLCLVPHLEFNEGVYYPKGGMISITHALYNLALKKGVQFRFNTPAERIIYNEGRVLGTVVNHQNIYSDIVVSNADIVATYKFLLNDPVSTDRLLKKERSSSAIVFYWGVNKEFPHLQLHNIFFSKNYKAEFDHIFRRKKMYEDPTVYVNITGKIDSDHAPTGKENWFVMVNAPSNCGQDWEDIKQYCRKAVIDKLSRVLNDDLASRIVAEETLDPVSLETKTGSFMGSIYGASSDSRMTAFLKPANFDSQIRGLYFVGGTVHPGGGIPLCLKSAKIVSELIAEDNKKSHQH